MKTLAPELRAAEQFAGKPIVALLLINNNSRAQGKERVRFSGFEQEQRGS